LSADTPAKPSRYVVIALLKLSSTQALEQAIFKLGSACAVADSVWILASIYPLVTIHNLLRPVLRSADQLVIVDIARDKATWAGYGPSDEARLRQMWNVA
jgi:hypothetical protein